LLVSTTQSFGSSLGVNPDPTGAVELPPGAVPPLVTALGAPDVTPAAVATAP